MTHLLGVPDGEAERLHAELRAGRAPQLPGAVRASIGIGTTGEDIDRLVGALREIARYGPRSRYVHVPEHDEYRSELAEAAFQEPLHGEPPSGDDRTMANDEITARGRLAEAIAEKDLLPEDLQELRLALVMTGGVSLAVWMGGVALEFGRLIRAEQFDTTYLELLRLTRSLPRVDVIAGTSAGGLNGALLAYAITQDAEVAGLRGLWLRLGALEELLRQPTSANPPSLMRGDEYFLPELKNAIDSSRPRAPRPDDVPMDLIITTTLLNAWPRGMPGHFGTIIQDAEHRGEFIFRRGRRASATTA